jgi:hypothetical protein
MRRYRIPKFLIFIIVVVLVQLACGPLGGDNNGGGDGPDYSATEASLAKTQAALDAQKPEATQPPVATPFR